MSEHVGLEEDSWATSFRSRLNFLVAMVPPPSGEKWTNELIAEECLARGVEATYSNIAHLRTGRRTNPSARLVGALAQVFGVDVDYFFNDLRAHQIQKQFLALQQLRESGVKIEGIAARGEGLKPDLVMEAIRALRRDSDDRR